MRKIILPCLVLLCLFNESFSQGTCATANTIPVANSNCNNYPMGALGTGVDFSPVAATGVTCTGTYPANRRVTWFKFTPTTDILSVRFVIFSDYEDLSGATGQTQVVFYDPNNGANCPASITSTAAGSGLQNALGICDADGQNIDWQPSNTDILRANRTYFLRVYQNTGVDASALNINICAYPVPINTITMNNAPANFPMSPWIATGGRNYSSVGGTSSQRCNYAANRRVTWFKFTPSASCATFNINVDGNPQTEVAFFDPNVANPFIPVSTTCLTSGVGVFAPKGTTTSTYNLVPGNTYYLRIYTNQNNNNLANINIQANSTAPANDLCGGATELDLNGINNETNSCMSGGATEPIPQAWVCASVLHNTAWYYITVANSAAPTTIQVDQVQCVGNAGSGTPQIQVGATLYNGGNCQTGGVLTRPGGANKCYQGTGSPPGLITIPANTSGVVSGFSKIYIAVDGYGGANCTYRILPSNAIPIPVKLKLFTAWKQPGRNQLKWITTTELNNAYFEIERSTDGKNFTAIGRVEGAGNSDQDIQYKFDDLNYPLVAYYRLKQVDLDGKYDYSNVVMIKRDDQLSQLSISFANPVINATRLTISTERAGIVHMQIVDAAGRSLQTQIVTCTPGNTFVMKDFSKLAAGSYYLVLMQGDEKIIKPFIKQ